MEETQQVESNETHAASAAGFPLQPEELRAQIQVTENQHKYRLTHVFEPVTAADWLEFDRLTRVVMESDEETIEFDSMAADAAEWLWSERIRTVEGYDPNLPDDWKDLIHLRHKEAALKALAQVYPVETGDKNEPGPEYLALGKATVVALEAARNGVEFPSLHHRLRRPTTSQQKEYSRRTSQTAYARGTRKKAKALVASHLDYLLELYDELIESVEGYEPNDPKLMDPLHKRAAVEVLFGKNG